MTGRTHVLSGALAVAAFAPMIGAAVGVEWSLVALAGGTLAGGAAGLLPDIDHPDGSIAHGSIPFVSKLLGPFGLVITWLASAPWRFLGSVVRVTMGHRGPTHTLVGLVFFTVFALPFYALCLFGIVWVVSLIASVAGYGFSPSSVVDVVKGPLVDAWPAAMIVVFLAVASHLVVDMLNTVPLRILWPLSKRPFFLLPKGLRIRVQSPGEWVFQKLVLIALLLVLAVTVLRAWDVFADTDSIRAALLGPIGGA